MICHTLKERAIMKCRISDLLRMDDEEMKRNVSTVKNLLYFNGDYLGDEIINENSHTCNLKSYRVKGQSQVIRRSITKKSQCWCTCSNYEKGGKCSCNCGMIFNVIMERTEKDEFTKIQARLLDSLRLQEVMMIPDLTANSLDPMITLEDALKPMDGHQFRFVDRIINY